MLKEAYEALYLNEKLKNMTWRSKKMAVNYNLAMIRKGL